MEIYNKFSDAEIDKLLKENLVILHDTREQVNQHVLDYFDRNKIAHKMKKIDEGDYTAIISKCPAKGIYRDLYFKVAVERKNGVDEFVGNLCEKTDSRDDIRLIRELERAKHKGIMMFLVIEDKDCKEKIEQGKYRSGFEPQAVMGRLSSIEVRFLCGTEYVNKENTGKEIYRKLKYAVRYFLGRGEFDIGPEEIL